MIKPTSATSHTLIYCPVCRQTSRDLGPSRHGLLQACLNCGSLDRHRMMALIVKVILDSAKLDYPVLDFAPTSALSSLIAAAVPNRYVSTNIVRESEDGDLHLVADIAQLPIRDDSFSLIICSHVLEHVRDDFAAMVEIARVLHPSGVALILTPRRRGHNTEEDPTASIEERIERFGQDDHVRLYGDDLERRLNNAGLGVATVDFTEVLDDRARRLIGITTGGEAWIATLTRDPSTVVVGDELVDVLLASILGDLDVAIGERNEAVAEAEKWWKHYDWLNNQPVVRVARRAKKVVSLGRGSDA